jgi:hypothetical protein
VCVCYVITMREREEIERDKVMVLEKAVYESRNRIRIIRGREERK